MKHLEGKTVAAEQEKGGCGKTTLVMGLALTVKHEYPDLEVVIVDLEGQATKWMSDCRIQIRCVRAFPKDRTRVFTIVDTPGGNPFVASEGILRSDLVLVPLRASNLDIAKAEDVIQAVSGAGKTIGWVPSQVHTGVAVEEELGATLRRSMQQGRVPPGLILPSVRYLPSMASFLEGKRPHHPVADFAAIWQQLDRYFKRPK